MKPSRTAQLTLRSLALAYLFALVVVPIVVILWRTFDEGVMAFLESVRTPAAISALNLSLLIVAVVVPVNVVFGVITAIALVRWRFPGRGLLQAVVDLPFAVSPIVVGVSLIMLWGVHGWFGGLESLGFKVIFGLPGMVIATIFVTLPFVVREVEPVLHEIGTDQEQAASTLGASAWQTFWRITVPAIRWGLTYGVVLTIARALGEFGAVIMVSSGFPGVSQTLTLLVHSRYIDDHNTFGAYSAATLLMMPCAGDPARNDPARPEEELDMITVTGAHKNYGDFKALDDVSLAIPAGSLTALLGPSGSGKSTLLRSIAGLEGLDSGRIAIDGRDVTGVPPQNRGIGFVFQHYAAFKHMTVRDNVAFGLVIRKRPRKEITKKVDELLEIVGLDGFQHRYPAQLSGGQRQRMALARALAVDPSVLLLDEPFGALDAKVRADLRRWLRRLHDEVHVTTVLVTHDQEEALDVSDRIAVLNAGRIEQVGKPDELYERPANDFVMSFLGSVANLNGTMVRPHDIRLERESSVSVVGDGQPAPTRVRATVERIVRLGFEVRVDLVNQANGERFAAQVTRAVSEALGLRPGETVHAIAPAGPPAAVRQQGETLAV